MGADGLRQWAVMNLSMEDRGLQPSQAPEAAAQGASGFLDAQLSFFGVRSDTKRSQGCVMCGRS
jgi:hypothetical protein